ncbi:helix-turn-helix transcriptional regulator [Companilactobacillus sp. FL22-1]|uniref:helix-turn-helix transcriptional regulator n=1 Tax=Companilactobacillus sp. FL22-1 TaxID=3373892 RepID=UPI0037552933
MDEVDQRKLPKSLIRIIDIIMRLLQGEKINSETVANLYGVNKRTIYRDLQVIRENSIFNSNYQMQFDPKQKIHFVVNEGKISTKEVLTISQIVRGSRALSKAELTKVIKHLQELVDAKDQPKIEKLLNREYLPFKTNGHLLEYIDDFTRFVESQTQVEFTYQGSRPNSDTKKVRRAVPMSLYFADFYFYVTMFSEEKGARVYRLDRILSYTSLKKAVNVPRINWQDGASVRNFTYLLNGGPKSYFKLQYKAYPWTALDKLPNSRVVSHEADGSVIIEGYMYTQGLKHWVLGQGTFVKVIEPHSLIEEVKQELQASLDQYKN